MKPFLDDDGSDASEHLNTGPLGLFDHPKNSFIYGRIIYDQDSKPVDFLYLDVNKAYEKFIGLHRKFIIGHRSSDLLPGSGQQNVALLDFAGQIVYTGKPDSTEIFIEHLNLWLSVAAYCPQQGHFVAAFEDITERKNTERALKESEERFSLLFNICIDGGKIYSLLPDGTPTHFIEVNEAAYRAIGYTKKELQQLTPNDIDNPATVRQKNVAQTMMVEGSFVVEQIHIAPDGRRTPVKISSRFVEINGKPCSISMVRDITEKKLARERLESLVSLRTAELTEVIRQLTKEINERVKVEAALRESVAHFKSLYEKLPVGYQSLDPEGCFLDINPAWLNTLGYERNEVIGKPFSDFLIAEEKTLFWERFSRFKERGEVQTEFTMLRKSGAHALISINGRIDYDSNGQSRKTHCLMLDITEQRRIEEEICRLASLPLVNPNPIMRVSPQGEVLFANNASRPLLECWNTRIGGILPDEWKFQICEIFASGEMKNIEVQCGERFFDLKIFPSFEFGVLNLYALEITKRKQIAEELEISEANYRMLFDNASDAMILWEVQNDGEFKVKEANRIALERYGYTREEILDLTGKDLNTVDSYQGVQTAVDQMMKTGYATYELTHIAKNGRYIPSEVYGHAFDLNGKKVVLAVVRDISERKRAETEKALYQERLETVVDERTLSLLAEIASRQKAEDDLQHQYEHERSLSRALKKQIDERIFFTRALVHELKTPLTPLLGSSEILVNMAKEEPFVSLSRNVHSGAVKLQKRIDQLLDLARSEVGLLKLRFASVDLLELIHEMVAYVSPTSGKKGLTITLDLPVSLPKVRGEREYLHRVILNLLDNAVKYTPKGGRVAIRAYLEKAVVTVEIADTGIGISPERINRLFVPYSRVAADETQFAGLGLGLALCKTIVELHGGRIWIESPAQGTVVRFTIPVGYDNGNTEKRGRGLDEDIGN